MVVQESAELHLGAVVTPELELVSLKVEIAVYSAAASGPVPQELLNPDGRELTARFRASLQRKRDKLEADVISVPRNSPARKSVNTHQFRLLLIDFAEQQARSLPLQHELILGDARLATRMALCMAVITN